MDGTPNERELKIMPAPEGVPPKKFTNPNRLKIESLIRQLKVNEYFIMPKQKNNGDYYILATRLGMKIAFRQLDESDELFETHMAVYRQK